MPRQEQGKQVMTVNGLLPANEMGITLAHEHLFADLRSYDEQAKASVPIDTEEVLEVVLPYLKKLRGFQCRTLVDCTATHLGRHPKLLKRLADESGINVLTVTGCYLSADQRFMPPYVRTQSADELAQRWVSEWQGGIDDSGIRPGLIKLGFNGGPLTQLERKVFQAALIAHLQTGLTIATHVGPWREVDAGFNARSALDQLDLLEQAKISPSSWIWVHAQNEKDANHLVRAAERGAWISLDGLSSDSLATHIDLVKRLHSRGLLNRVLVSHDAGWYNAGQPGGGTFRSFDTAFTMFIPALRTEGFGDAEIQTIFVRNPAEALAFDAGKLM
jgi:phosphotriesterase-related protein